MNKKEAESVIEAVLFASGDPVTTEELNNILGVTNAAEIADGMAQKWAEEKRGLAIKRVEDKYYICTNNEFFEYITRLVEPRRQTGLSNAALETLSIVVYNQPVTRAFIEQVRGVDCGAVLQGLMTKELVEEKGRLELPGRPLLYGTTATFLRSFSISSLNQLPPLPEEEAGVRDTTLDEVLEQQGEGEEPPVDNLPEQTAE